MEVSSNLLIEVLHEQRILHPLKGIEALTEPPKALDPQATQFSSAVLPHKGRKDLEGGVVVAEGEVITLLKVMQGSIEATSAQPVEDVAKGKYGQEDVGHCKSELLLFLGSFIIHRLFRLHPTHTFL